MSKLLDLMHELGRDAALAKEYEVDREAVMQRAGLSEEECQALRDMDHEAIKRLTGLTGDLSVINHVIRAYDE